MIKNWTVGRPGNNFKVEGLHMSCKHNKLVWWEPLGTRLGLRGAHNLLDLGLEPFPSCGDQLFLLPLYQVWIMTSLSDMPRHRLVAFPRVWAPPMCKVNTSEVRVVISAKKNSRNVCTVKSVSLHRWNPYTLRLSPLSCCGGVQGS